MLYESLAGQCEYATQPKGSFWCHVFGTKGAILLVMLLKFSFRYVKVKAVAEPQECQAPLA